MVQHLFVVHCWDYRRFLLENCNEVTVEQELDFTTEKISSNFSNFSSWHLRSKLLPKLSKDFLGEELELIRNAVFTDPKDQSAWFYHRWLLKSQLQQGITEIAGNRRKYSTIIFLLISFKLYSMLLFDHRIAVHNWSPTPWIGGSTSFQ